MCFLWVYEEAGKGVVNTRFNSVLEVLMDTNEMKYDTFIVREILPTTVVYRGGGGFKPPRPKSCQTQPNCENC